MSYLFPGWHGVPEVADFIPLPEGRVTGNSTRSGQTTFEGASYFLRKQATVGNLVVRVTGHTGVGTLRFLVYQQDDGLSGVATLRGTVTGFNPGGTGNFTIPFAEGTIKLVPGLVYVLWGRDSAVNTITLQTYTTQAVNLMTANVVAATHPTSWTTAVASTTTPATFDPTSGTATASDVIPVFRVVT